MSLNDCLETSPQLQILIWNILIRTTFRPTLLCGDTKKLFLHIKIREGERVVLRFHRVESLEMKVTEVLKTTRLIFKLSQSLFIAEGTLRKHSENYRDSLREVIKAIEENIYIDDMVTGWSTLDEVKQINNSSVLIFQKGDFTVHQWSSNVSEL